jgi:hypothetical protein
VPIVLAEFSLHEPFQRLPFLRRKMIPGNEEIGPRHERLRLPGAPEFSEALGLKIIKLQGESGKENVAIAIAGG